MREGPPVEMLMKRLAETPDEFLATPVMIDGPADKTVDAAAVVSDLLFDTGGQFIDESMVEGLILKASAKNRSYLGTVLVLCHLLHDDWFIHDRANPENIMAFFTDRRLR